MPIPFTCPHCGTHTDVAEEYAGQTGPCARCGQMVTVPLPGMQAGGARASGGLHSAALVGVVVVVMLLVLLFCGGGLLSILWVRTTSFPPVVASRSTQGPQQTTCQNNLKWIALAMHNYHDVHKCFPPAYVPDKDGRPMHSWRVLILPFLEEQDLYNQYRFDEPWDGPHNRRLASAMPAVYRCPVDIHNLGEETSYMMLVGPGTISDGPTATSFRQITDGTSNTILVVEVAGSGVDWMEPKDLDATQISFRVNEPGATGISSNHPGIAYAARCDGSVTEIDQETDPAILRAMSTIAGGEAVPPPE